MKERFLIKLGPKLKVIPSKALDDLNPNQAIAIGLACHIEQRKQLLQDAILGDRYYYKYKVVDALGASIDRLAKSFPTIRDSINVLSLNVSN